ncbi:MAG TPA: glycosyltransferase family 4 protein [Candidatus Dormibacteraeota bacterium]|jgi:glycosyltransferase involved in cell wall biosynthesis|nr:glycosyltransferase family 4 protein [Candidatus Dormibacteraeota bacterium]
MNKTHLRIAVLHCGFTYSGGGERIVIEQVLGLRRRGHEVKCFAPTVSPARSYPDLLPALKVKTFLPQLPSWVPLREALQMVAASALVPLYAWRFRSFDVMVAANQPSAWIAWCLSRILGKPYLVYLNQPNRLVHPRSVDRLTGWVANPDYRLLSWVVTKIRRFVDWADRVSVAGAAELLVNGRYIGDIIRTIYERSAHDCPAGCHVEEGYPRPTEERFEGGMVVNGFMVRRPYVLLTNRHYPQKRFDLAILAMAEVRKHNWGAQLVIPGPATPHTEDLKVLVAELEMGRQVLFLGEISESELLRLYHGAAAYVYPAPEEDFGMGVIESMACGVPVVAWDQAGPTGTVVSGSTGFLITPTSITDYAQAIERLLADPVANQGMGRQAHARARQFSWENHLDILERTALAVAAGNALDPEMLSLPDRREGSHAAS